MDNINDHHEYCQGDYDPEDIVISGIAGRFPECDNIGELVEKVTKKMNLIVYSDTRYEKGACKVPFNSGGIISNLEKFDADYFCLPYATVHSMDPQTRKVLEVSYEAMADAGYDPASLKGANIGVYNATTNDDAQLLTLGQDSKLSGFSWLRCLNANRVSYGFDFIGPSFSVDTACSSSAVATWCAIKDMRDNTIDAALLNACQLDLSPYITHAYLKHGICSATGVNSMPFDANTDGINRTEAATALFLQKAKNARRCYAKLISANFLTCGYVPEGISVPSLNMQVKVSKRLLEDNNLSPDDIDYFEAHGTGTSVGDPIELNSIATVYCNEKRKRPMYIGSIKSNIGHTEAAAGLCGIIKSAMSLEKGYILPNYKYSTPNPCCPALVEGQLKVVTEPVPVVSPYIPVNSFGLAGTIVQIMLKQNPKDYTNHISKKLNIPRFILFPGTCDTAIQFIFDYVRDHPDLPNEFFALLNKLSFTPTFLKPIRGYAFYQDPSNPVSDIKFFSSNKRQVWFIYTGMGCQWRGMGLQLMDIDIFANSMKKCADVLKPFGVDLFEIIKPESDLLEKDRKITNAIVGIAAIQIALTDVLRALDIQPDGIMGHSTGEVMAAYADGCTTLEQTILSCYWRGYSIENNNKERGAMAAVGLTWEEALERCPANVYPSCHNASDSVTISGLEKDVTKFVSELTKENIFAKVVNAYGYCFHCKYTRPAAPQLLENLVKVITNPKQRTSRWVSTSYLEHDWDLEECKVANANYFVHNLVSPVLFSEAMQHIPSDAITIEIGPHHLLQSILKRGVGADSVNIGLMKRNDPNNLKFFFESIGKLYTEGVDPKIENLYPPVQFPVPRGTPCISDLIKWNYSMDFEVPKWSAASGETTHTFDLERGDSYLMDHFIDGRSLFPATGYIYLAWEMLASKLHKECKEMPVIIENFKIHRATVLTQSTIEFNFNILSDSGHFEITDGHSVVASGQVYEWKHVTFAEPDPTYQSSDSAVLGADIYNELKMAGYEYKHAFQELLEINMDGTQGLVQWQDRWIPFLDSLLLFFGLITNSSDFQLPTGALSFKIDPTILYKKIEDEDSSEQGLPVNFNPDTKVCRSVGIEITKLQTDPAPHRAKDVHPTLEEYRYIPYICSYVPDKDSELYLLRYMWACNKMLDIVGQKLGMDVKSYKFCVGSDSGISFEEYMESVTEKHSLLKCLQDISENSKNIKSKKNDLYSAFSKTICRDILNSIMITEYPLRIMLEILTENTFRKLNVVEVSNSGFSIVLPSIIEMIKKYSYSKFKSCLLITPPNVEVNGEELDENNIQHQLMDSLENLAKQKDQDIVIGSYMGGSLNELKENIKRLSSVIKSTGFILFYCKEKLSPAEKLLLNLYGEDIQIQSRSVVEKVFQENNLLILSKIFDSFSGAVYLLRQTAPIVPYKVLKVTEDNEYTWVEELKNSLEANETDNVWLVAEDTAVNGIVGMINCLKQEPGGERVKCVFLSPLNGESKPPAFNFEQPFFKSLLARNLIMNVWRDGSWGSFRHVLLNDQKELKSVEHSYVNCRKFGDLSSFEWIESHVKYAARTTEKLVHIYYSALNFKDVMLATGKLSVGTTKSITGQADDSVLGLEFSGRDESGRRVAGVISARGMATSTLVDPNMLIEVPAKWTLEEAATVPVVYATSYYAIIVRAQLRKGEKILIHSGTGGIGIAAINIALSLGCEVFSTVGNDDKKKYLRKLFPQIKEENIGCSRSTSFETMVMKRTNGKGVDVVLNSLADDKFLASVRCVAKHGRFIEIGKYDLSLDRNLGLKVFLENISFHGVFLDQLFERNPHNIETFNHVMQLVRDGIKSGVVKPLDRTLFRRDEVEQAFRYMAKGIHVGKVVLKIRDEEPEKTALPKTLILPAVPNTYFYNNKVYIIIGGLGGFGIEVTKWVLQRGGRNIILTSRYGARTPYQHLCLRRWKKMGANVQVLTLNAAKHSEAEQLIKEAAKVGPVGGIINSAVVLKDAFIDQQTSKNYNEVCAPKAIATRYLDELSRKLCPQLDYFICFSSISCGRGNAGQTNYGYANSVMERICEQRRSKGLHGLAIQWGIIGEVGVVHRHMGDDAMIAGVCAQSVKSCLEAMDLFCQANYPVVSSYMAAVVGKKADQQLDIVEQIVKILGISGDISDVRANRSLGEMGIDSLIGVEIRQLLESSLDISVSMQELLEMKVKDLRDLASKARTKETAAPKMPSLVSTADIKLPTMSNNEPIVSLSKITTGLPVFIINIGDIDINSFSLFAQLLKRPVYTLQWTKHINAKNMEELAQYYLNLMKLKTKGSFHLMAFGMGGSLAFELAKVCDNVILRGVSLLDGTTNFAKILNKESDNRDPEVSSLLSFVEQFCSEAAPKLESELQKAKTLDQRTKIVLNFLTSTSTETINKNEISEAISEFMRKEKVIQSYEPKGNIHHDFCLFEDPVKVLANDITDLKRAFSQVVSGKVSIHRIFSQKDLSNKDALNKVINVLDENVFSKFIN